MGGQSRAGGFAGNHKAAIAIVVVGVVLAAVCFGLSSKFILDSKGEVTSTFNLSMQADDGRKMDVAAFTRRDGNLSITFVGSFALFGGTKGSLQGTMEEEFSNGSVDVVRLADAQYDRTTYLRAAHYTTYVLRPSGGGMPGIWGIRIVDDNGTEPDACYWMSVKADGTVVLGTEMQGNGWEDMIRGIESSDTNALTWTKGDDGAILFSDSEGRAFEVKATGIAS